VNSAPPDPGLGLGLSPERRRTPLRPTQGSGSDSGSAPEDDELRFARPQGSDSALTSADDLRLARPRGSDSTSATEDRLDLGGASTSPNLGRGLTTSTGGAIISLPQADSGYGEQDRRPARSMTMAALSPLTEARGRQQGLDSPDNCPSARLQRSSDSHDTTRTWCQNLSGCHDGMYLGR
jgi:hypothetical protein